MARYEIKKVSEIYSSDLFEEEQPDYPSDEADSSTYDEPAYVLHSCSLSDNDNTSRIASYASSTQEVSAKKSS